MLEKNRTVKLINKKKKENFPSKLFCMLLVSYHHQFVISSFDVAYYD
jgi:hypothetical protein